MSEMRKLIKIIENIENGRPGPIHQADEFAKAAFAAGIKLGNEWQYDSGGYEDSDISPAYDQWKKNYAAELNFHGDPITESEKGDSRCKWCGGEMKWCPVCNQWTKTCCQEYGTCQCS